MQRNLIINLLLFLIVIIFAVQNSEAINLRLFFWDVNLSKALLIIIVLLIGVVLGILSSAVAGRRKKSKKVDKIENKENTPKDENK